MKEDVGTPQFSMLQQELALKAAAHRMLMMQKESTAMSDPL